MLKSVDWYLSRSSWTSKLTLDVPHLDKLTYFHSLNA